MSRSSRAYDGFNGGASPNASPPNRTDLDAVDDFSSSRAPGGQGVETSHGNMSYQTSAGTSMHDATDQAQSLGGTLATAQTGSPGSFPPSSFATYPQQDTERRHVSPDAYSENTMHIEGNQSVRVLGTAERGTESGSQTGTTRAGTVNPFYENLPQSNLGQHQTGSNELHNLRPTVIQSMHSLHGAISPQSNDGNSSPTPLLGANKSTTVRSHKTGTVKSTKSVKAQDPMKVPSPRQESLLACPQPDSSRVSAMAVVHDPTGQHPPERVNPRNSSLPAPHAPHAASTVHSSSFGPLFDARTDPTSGVIVVKYLGREIKMLQPADLVLFEELLVYKGRHPDENVEDVFHHFVGRPHLDALLKVVYTTKDFVWFLPDAVLKYEVDTSKNNDKFPQRRIYRHEFEKHLLTLGCILDKEINYKKDFYFLKVFVSFESISKEAEEAELRYELRPNSQFLPILQTANLASLRKVIRFRRDRIGEYTRGDPAIHTPYTIQTQFFTRAERNMLTFDMMSHIRIPGKTAKARRGVHHLVKIHAYHSFFAVHDGSAHASLVNNDRARLLKSWQQAWLRRQPLTDIRNYFGEKFALYFGWLEFYTLMLIVPAIIGMTVFGYGILVSQCLSRGTYNSATALYRDVYAASASDPAKQNLLLVQIVFDNDMTAFFALFMSVWATLFLEMWKRRSNTLACRWLVMDFEKDEVQRADWYTTATRVSPITGKKEAYFPHWVQRRRQILSGAIILALIGVVLIGVAGFIAFKAWLAETLKASLGAPYDGYISGGIAAVASILLILTLSESYQGVAVWLNDRENYRTETVYEDALVLKSFLFNFVNNYATLFYIGIVKAWIGSEVFGRFNTPCQGTSGKACLVDLFIQVAIIFLVSEYLRTFFSTIFPYMILLFNYYNPFSWWKKNTVAPTELKDANLELEDTHESLTETMLDKQLGPGNHRHPQYMKDDLLPDVDVATSLRGRYSVMVTQFGFLTMFTVAFPLAPLFAIINNVVTIRGDAFKFLVDSKRPFALRAQDIGQWQGILAAMGYISVMTNGLIIAFASTYFQYRIIDRFASPEYPELAIRLLFFLAFEHILIVCKIAFAFLIPDVPKEVKVAQAREEYLAEVALEGLQDEDDENLESNVVTSVLCC